MQRIEIDEVSERPQAAAQNVAECAEKPFDLGPPATSAISNVKHDQEDQKTGGGAIKDGNTERDESKNGDTESEKNDQTTIVEDHYLEKASSKSLRCLGGS